MTVVCLRVRRSSAAWLDSVMNTSRPVSPTGHRPCMCLAVSSESLPISCHLDFVPEFLFIAFSQNNLPKFTTLLHSRPLTLLAILALFSMNTLLLLIKSLLYLNLAIGTLVNFAVSLFSFISKLLVQSPPPLFTLNFDNS